MNEDIEFPEEMKIYEIELMVNATQVIEKDQEWHVKKIGGKSNIIVENGAKLIVNSFEGGKITIKRGGELVILEENSKGEIITE